MNFKKLIFRTFLMALLSITLLTSCKKDKKDSEIESPNWSVVNPQDYEYSMTFVTQIAFDNVVSTNVLSELGAFVGDECRGKANLAFESELEIYLCHLIIYSSVASGEQITLKAYNPETQKIYSNCGISLIFQNNSSEGGAGMVLNCGR